MPLTKINFASGDSYYYSNETNLLYDKDRGLFAPFKADDHTEYIAQAKSNYNSRKKSNTPVALRILMGHACNYSCTYCMQKDIGNPDEIPKRKNLDSWCKDIETNLDLSKLERIELWGGEPFLYWHDMVALMEFFDKEGLTFAISTNGSCLSAKHAEFFGKLKSDVIVSISHDGPRQLELRGEEILGRSRVISTLKMFDKLANVSYGFQCSLTNTNYDLFAINKFFRDHILEHKLNPGGLSFSLGRTYQEGAFNSQKDCNSALIGNEELEGDLEKESITHVIHGENLEKFRVILADYLEAHRQQFISNGFIGDDPAVYSLPIEKLPLLLCDIYESSIAYSVTEYSRKLLTQEPILETTNCGADMSDILSLDLDGSVRTCPHAGEKYIHGSVNNLKGVRVVSLNLTRNEGHCNTCVSKKLCRSSCPLSLPKETFLTNCNVEKVWYGEIQKASFKFIFGKNVTSMEEAA
jgi:radical SAM protein with 4Fe4S-binding SPASM domain